MHTSLEFNKVFKLSICIRSESKWDWQCEAAPDSSVCTRLNRIRIMIIECSHLMRLRDPPKQMQSSVFITFHLNQTRTCVNMRKVGRRLTTNHFFTRSLAKTLCNGTFCRKSIAPEDEIWNRNGRLWFLGIFFVIRRKFRCISLIFRYIPFICSANFASRNIRDHLTTQIDGFRDSPVVFQKTNRTEITCDLLRLRHIVKSLIQSRYSEQCVCGNDLCRNGFSFARRQNKVRIKIEFGQTPSLNKQPKRNNTK